MINRFTKINPTTYQDVGFYTPNFEAWDQAFAQQQADIDQGNLLSQLGFNYRDADADLAGQYNQKRQDDFSALAEIYKEQGTAAGNRALRNYKNQINTDFMPGGLAHMMSANYDTEQAHINAIKATAHDSVTQQKLIDSINKNPTLTPNEDGGYDILKGAQLNRLQTQPILSHVDLAGVGLEAGKLVKPLGWAFSKVEQNPDGTYTFFDEKGSRVSKEKVGNALTNIYNAMPQVKAYVDGMNKLHGNNYGDQLLVNAIIGAQETFETSEITRATRVSSAGKQSTTKKDTEANVWYEQSNTNSVFLKPTNSRVRAIHQANPQETLMKENEIIKQQLYNSAANPDKYGFELSEEDLALDLVTGEDGVRVPQPRYKNAEQFAEIKTSHLEEGPEKEALKAKTTSWYENHYKDYVAQFQYNYNEYHNTIRRKARLLDILRADNNSEDLLDQADLIYEETFGKEVSKGWQNNYPTQVRKYINQDINKNKHLFPDYIPAEDNIPFEMLSETTRDVVASYEYDQYLKKNLSPEAYASMKNEIDFGHMAQTVQDDVFLIKGQPTYVQQEEEDIIQSVAQGNTLKGALYMDNTPVLDNAENAKLVNDFLNSKETDFKVMLMPSRLADGKPYFMLSLAQTVKDPETGKSKTEYPRQDIDVEEGIAPSSYTTILVPMSEAQQLKYAKQNVISSVRRSVNNATSKLFQDPNLHTTLTFNNTQYFTTRDIDPTTGEDIIDMTVANITIPFDNVARATDFMVNIEESKALLKQTDAEAETDEHKALVNEAIIKRFTDSGISLSQSQQLLRAIETGSDKLNPNTIVDNTTLSEEQQNTQEGIIQEGYIDGAKLEALIPRGKLKPGRIINLDAPLSVIRDAQEKISNLGLALPIDFEVDNIELEGNAPVVTLTKKPTIIDYLTNNAEQISPNSYLLKDKTLVEVLDNSIRFDLPTQ